ncbi:hypothetical protein B0G71_4586 [Paraburkholderia sp. BL27I4N3]|nr:hypothetical protein B0G71_4586 [Paraburkholderia sp. BL27I4N3]RKR38560.1 hypothetical protein B0G82_6703 [Paraburkholderia sp. BL17N1]
MAAAPLMQINDGCGAARLFVSVLKRHLTHDEALERAC